VTREEVLDLAREVLTWKSRSYVGAAKILAAWVLEVAEVEYHAQLGEINRLHTRCADLLEEKRVLKEEMEVLRRSELPTEKRLRGSKSG
jgi:hypothetical protein